MCCDFDLVLIEHSFIFSGYIIIGKRIQLRAGEMTIGVRVAIAMAQNISVSLEERLGMSSFDFFSFIIRL